ncbi:MAG TPA: tetratricopeptide repeat protein [Myxococcota bacterium]|nr:tetratricopeptide repeat protein [Myxococcota bacterium]
MTKPEPAVLEQRVGALRSFLKREPNDETAWYGLGRALLDLGRSREAVSAFRQALAAKPNYTAAQRDLGVSLLADGESAAAAEAFREGIAMAEETGDLQTGREMAVFLRRALRAAGPRSDPPARS